MDPDTRHNDRTTPEQEPTARRGIASAERPTGDRLEPPTHLALAGRGRRSSDPLGSRREAHFLYGVLGLDRQAVESPPHPSTPLRPSAPADRAPGALVVYPQPGGLMARQHGQWVLRRPTRDFRVERSSQTRPTQPDRADVGRRTSVPRFRLLRRLARRAMAEYLAAVSLLPLGPSRSW